MQNHQMDADRIRRKLRQNPKIVTAQVFCFCRYPALTLPRTQVVANARSARNSQDLMELANFWQEDGPRFLQLGVLDVFFGHLKPEKVPSEHTPASRRSLTADCAFMSLVGLSKAANFLCDPSPYSGKILEAWPGLFKWSSFFYAVHIQNGIGGPQAMRAIQDFVSASFVSVSRVDRVTEIMASTPGSVELATKLWIIEDAGDIPSVIDIPSASAALDALLKDSTDIGDTLDRVIRSSGGQVENVTKLCISRLRTAYNGPRFHEPRTAIYLDLIGHLSRKFDHPIRFAFLSSNIITLCTKIAGAAAKALNRGGPPGLADVMVAAFGYLTNCIESTDGFTWVIHAIHAGLFQAFVDGSGHFDKIGHSEDKDIILELFRKILPKYLVYRSVIQAVDGGIRRVQDSPTYQPFLASRTPARKAWSSFHELALERRMTTIYATAVKGRGMTCDNVKCQKLDHKNNFQKCSSCQTTLYCSKECQTIAWKEGGHRTMCKLKVQERMEGKLQSISKSDAAFFHALAIRDARHHLPYFKKLGLKEFPGTPLTSLVAYIDYTVNPPKYTLFPLADYEKNLPTTNGSANAEARNAALVERARQNPGKFALISSKIANGRSFQLVLTLISRDFWSEAEEQMIQTWGEGWDRHLGDSESSDGLGEGDGDEENRLTTVDDVDMMMARMTLNNFLRSRGEPATF